MLIGKIADENESNDSAIPVNNTMQSIFNRVKRNFKLRVADGKEQNTDYVFTFNGEPVKDIKTAVNNAKIDDSRYHDCRHTFASPV